MPIRDDAGAETWMLFCSGGATRIDVDLHASGQRDHVGKVAHVVKDCDAAMRDAAERGCRAALAWAERRNGAAPACVISFDLPDVPAGRDVGDASGGLAFAVAAARAMHVPVPGAIAAMGEIESGLRDGPVCRVEGIEAKIEGAFDRLPAGGRLVYPVGNDSDVPPALRERLAERSIETTPVASVHEALDRLLPAVAADTMPYARGTDVQGGSGHGSAQAGVDGWDAKPPSASQRRKLAPATLRRSLIALGVAGAAGVAFWLSQGGPHAPAPSEKQADSGQESGGRGLPPGGAGNESALFDTRLATPLPPDDHMGEEPSADTTFKETPNDRGFQ